MLNKLHDKENETTLNASEMFECSKFLIFNNPYLIFIPTW